MDDPTRIDALETRVASLEKVMQAKAKQDLEQSSAIAQLRRAKTRAEDTASRLDQLLRLVTLTVMLAVVAAISSSPSLKSTNGQMELNVGLAAVPWWAIALYICGVFLVIFDQKQIQRLIDLLKVWKS
jgi:hypothetical protein